MLRALGVTALVAVAGVSPGPGTLRPARPADEAPRTGTAAMTQQWRVVATDARSHSALMLIADQSTGAQLFYWPTVPHTGVSQVFYDLGAPTGSSGFAVRGIALRHTAAGWVLQLDQGVVKLRLAFTGVRAGPLAAPWPVGQVSGPGVVPFASSLNWAVPVASATVNGTIEHDGTSIPLSGWRGYIDHTWGRFDFSLGLMQHWDWASSSRRRTPGSSTASRPGRGCRSGSTTTPSGGACWSTPVFMASRFAGHVQPAPVGRTTTRASRATSIRRL